MEKIEEIRARAGKKLTGINKYHGYIATKSSRYGEGVYDAIINRLYHCEYEDIPYLLDQADALQQENVKLKDNIAIHRQEIGKILAENAALKSERDELKKALELACRDTISGWSSKEPDDYIHQAQQEKEEEQK